MTEENPTKTNFIREIIDEHNRTGRFGGRVHTRFHPNPTATCTSVMPRLSASTLASPKTTVADQPALRRHQSGQGRC